MKDIIKKERKFFFDLCKMISILLIEIIIGYLFYFIGLREIHIFTIYIMGILITAMVTASQLCSVLSVCGIFIFNYLFADPLFSFQASNLGYPITFIILLIAALMLGTLAKKNRKHAKELAQTAYRNKVLLDTNQLLQTAKCRDEIVDITAQRLMKILHKNIIVFIGNEGKLEEPKVFLHTDHTRLSFEIGQMELDAALWTYHHNQSSGATFTIFEYIKGTYIPIHTAERIYGVIGIDLGKDELITYETQLILGECALAFEREFYNRESVEASLQAKNEKLRADLLRSISHDLRTPLTSISGNAALLAKQGNQLAIEKRNLLSEDIWKDSVRLINMVENLLSITKVEEVKKNIVMQPELLSEILLESFEHVNKLYPSHNFILTMDNEVQVVVCNAQLIMQVLNNLLENAVKYTKEGTKITLQTVTCEEDILVMVSDEGCGVERELRNQIFDMFYTTAKNKAEQSKGFGIGLALCKAIIIAHGSKITVSDNKPHGAIFSFPLKKAEVTITNEI